MKRKLDTFLKETHPVSGCKPAALSSASTSVTSQLSSLASKPTMAVTTIQLTPREQQLRGLLLDVAKSIDDAGHAAEPIVLRWAGGWVRDKLLNIQSHDIDVAINAMTGVPFAEHMCDYCEKPEAMAKHGIGPDDIGSLHNVARNPEKSKHLETAMVKMFGLDLDFVNLRKETYTEDSRNPQMEFGTAQEDALRRDATVNALFYNLHDDRVEDLTGGLSDMEAKIIKTPLEPFQTFMDDPLRVLRLVRFASRLQFTIDPNTRKFMADPRVLDALRAKISRERVGVELEKMLKGAHPYQALEFIDELQLYHAIFTDPTQEGLPVPDITRWHVAYGCLEHLLQDRSPASMAGRLAQTEDATYFAWNLSAIAPWMTVEEPPNPRKKPNAPPLVALVAREGFKAPNKLSDVIVASHRNRKEIMFLKNAVCEGKPFIQERDRFGMAIRKWDTPAGTWRLQVLNALLVDALETLPKWSHEERQSREEFLTSWTVFLNHLAELDVYEAPSLKRLLDGRQLAQALGTKPGRWTGQALEVCAAWQLRHPGETDPAGAVEEGRDSFRADMNEPQDLREATLLAAAHLTLNKHGDLDDEQLKRFVKAINENVISSKTGTGPSLLNEAGIACLSLLCSRYYLNLDGNTLLKIVSVTGTQDPWTTSITATVASDILNIQLPEDKLANFIVGPILQESLKPLFTRPSSRITASGRPSQYAPVQDRHQQLPEAQPWKHQAPWAVSALQWAVSMAHPSLLQEHWPLFTPVLLALAEDEEIHVKSRGLAILSSFMGKCPAQILQNTGIGRVFEDLTFPMLLYLPSITPEDQSTSIITPAYDVLIKMAESYNNPQSRERRQLLDRVLRDGIFGGHFHASQYTQIVRVLMQKAASIMNCLGIYSIKHIKNLLSMVSSVMTDPFAAAHPPTVLAATQTLSAIIINCWPRIQEAEHTEEIIRILALCWLNVQEESESTSSQLAEDDAEALSHALMHTSKMLQALWTRDSSKQPARLSEVIQHEPRLAKLFPPTSA
ncbi:hypothetical protein FZEAL_9961 [Fusarium zealandicum]|uniref:tRNA nucleotidyltransferase n=1 Tax=Fusarium zealandicum TaxID=1053134 RepID=A0A8H4U7C3_9HYPO|nr:hypothetical protein FZEAL_9961 [Fusarium zealandicum]